MPPAQVGSAASHASKLLCFNGLRGLLQRRFQIPPHVRKPGGHRWRDALAKGYVRPAELVPRDEERCHGLKNNRPGAHLARQGDLSLSAQATVRLAKHPPLNLRDRDRSGRG
jgi:hypothetical protein